MASMTLDDSVRLFDLDGHIDKQGVRYIGKAALQPDGHWVCLADVDGCLCRVLVQIRSEEVKQCSSTD